MKLHENPLYFIQVVENALQRLYEENDIKWYKVYSFYEKRYLNPKSPEKQKLKNIRVATIGLDTPRIYDRMRI